MINRILSIVSCRLTVVLLLILISGSKAFSINLSDREKYNFITVPYVSVDAENRPIVLSVNIAYPTVSATDKTPTQVNFIVLHNHPTICADYQAPSGTKPLDAGNFLEHGAMRLMTTEGALVISCDYLGYGYSKSRVHPYCNHVLTARNVLDGFVAALDTAKARGVKIADDYYTLNVGYSQGGGVSMAVQRYLETYADEWLQNIVRLKHTYCGAGPYDLELTYKELASQETLSYSCSIPLTIEGLYTVYKEGCMKQVDLDSVYISHDFREKVERVLARKDVETDAVCDSIARFVGKEKVNIADIIRPEILSHSSATARSLDKALSKCNMLDGYWIPKTPITMFQYTQDEVVPFANSEEAVKVLGDNVKLYTEKDNIQCTNFAVALMMPMLVSNPKNHNDYGTVFFVYFLDGILRNL